jgi:hypothetical protein
VFKILSEVWVSNVVVGVVCRLVVIGMCLRLLCSCVELCPVGHWVTADVSNLGFSKSCVFCPSDLPLVVSSIDVCIVVGGLSLSR